METQIRKATVLDMQITTNTPDFAVKLFEMQPTEVFSLMGTHGVTYGVDEHGEYATIGFNLPAGIFAEIEDGTFGQLQGFRVYNLDSDGTETDPLGEMEMEEVDD